MFNPEDGVILVSSRRERDAPGTRFSAPSPNDHRFRQAWEQDIADQGEDCCFCRHQAREHAMVVTEPHFYKPVSMYEIMRGDRTFENPHEPAGAHLVMVELGHKYEVVMLRCHACAADKDTGQSLCLSLDLDYGSVKDGRRHAAPTGWRGA